MSCLCVKVSIWKVRLSRIKPACLLHLELDSTPSWLALLNRVVYLLLTAVHKSWQFACCLVLVACFLRCVLLVNNVTNPQTNNGI